jgi:BlaI family penicillinase repressor
MSPRKTKQPRILTGQELEIMKLIWELGTATVRQVYERQRQHRKVAYTTVMTMMKILEEKGFLSRRPEGRAYVYEPVQPQSVVISGMVQDFVDRVFNGAAQPLVLSLLESKKLSEKDLADITRLIEGEEPAP